MIIKEINAKNCLTKSKITDYVINPYMGCQHDCKYCYAVFMKRFQNINDDWGKFVYAKINCPELLKKELEKNKPGYIWMSSVCDCYQPIESKYKLTRKILETIKNSPAKDKFEIGILTKSALVKRDFDIMKDLNVEIGLSINTLNESFSKKIEPSASLPKLRIETLKQAKESGFRTYGFISPVLPGITDLEELFRELQFCDYVWIELLNTKKSVLDRLMPIIKKDFPDKMKNFELMLNNYADYYSTIKKQARELEKDYKLKIKEIVVHNQ
ncbi:MAG: SPL family radical SAM protein [Nanoarchaeota archaeon]